MNNQQYFAAKIYESLKNNSLRGVFNDTTEP